MKVLTRRPITACAENRLPRYFAQRSEGKLSHYLGVAMKKALFLFFPISLAVLLVYCGNSPSGPQQITGLPRELSLGEQGLIAADNVFGLKLFREIHGQEEGGANLFISPLSVAMALGMTYNGAAGTTQEAMQATLELHDLTLEEVNQAYRDLIDLLRGLDPAVEFTLGNSIWYREGLPVRQEFLDVNREYFDAEVTGLDFASPDAAPTINAWVADKTNGRIEQIVEAPISPELVMFLINAIYFKGMWTTEFDKELTRDAPFTLADGSQKQVETMFYPEPDSVLYYADSQVEVLDLVYGGRAYSMTIVLPAQGTDLAPIIESLDSEAWNRWVGGLAPRKAIVAMPKFTLEYELEMNEVLRALGMEIAFEPFNADFSKIYQGPENLYISRVKHKTFVDVNEEGTEAAAVTSVEIGITSMPPMINVDRPFLFVIREKYSGTILFMGVMMDPAPGG